MLAALLGVLTLACTSGNTAPEPHWVELSSSHPTATVPAPKTDKAGRVRVQIRALDNPGLQGIAIRVALSNPDGSQTDLGAVSPFPVDRAGDLHVKLTPDAARRLGERGRQLLRDKFNFARYISGLEEMFSRVINQSAGCETARMENGQTRA